jgi:signal transduction histidine kinase/ActR/RegA family two-component response regulator
LRAAGAAEEPITDPVWLWAMPGEQKTRAHPLRLEGRVSYYDPGFNMLWLEQDGLSTYVQLAPPAPVMRTGQRVRIEGTIIPARGLTADTVNVTVLRDDEPPAGLLPTAGRINDLTALHARMVSVDAYVDGQQWIDDTHTRLSLIVENRPVIGWIRPDHPEPEKIPDWTGKFVRITALYSGRFDPSNTRTTIELWMGRQSDMQILGSLADSPLFSPPVTPINELYRLPRGTTVKVRGRIQAREPGVSLTLRDATGQVLVRSIQYLRLPLGTEVEAVGQVATSGLGWVVGTALYRPVPDADHSSAAGANPDQPLTNIANIRGLDPEEIARGRPVKIAGAVTWALPGTDFFFLQDLSGGIRVHYDPAKMPAPALAKYLEIEGRTRDDRFAPAVALERVRDLGAMSAPAARPITLGQALTGRENGQWVELRGFLQSVTTENDMCHVRVTTPDGEFTVLVALTPVRHVANPGSLIRVRGACETTTDAAGRISGVTLLVPFIHDITVEEDAPADYYNLPLTAVKNLRQLGASRDMTRARVIATVLHAVPGQAVYVEDNGTALQLLSRETVPLAPGDRIEAVGILGQEGPRTILRETVYRRIGRGPPPAPLVLSVHAPPVAGHDLRLATMRGTLLNRFDRPGQTRLTLQEDETHGALFEAVLDHAGPAPQWPLDAGLELTGLYQLEFDHARQIRGFHLRLRTPEDVTVFRAPRLWTARRALIAAAILGGSTLLGLAWITALRRRVRRQTEQIRAQLEHQTRLEVEVQRAARLESLGVLAGGIAHDFNNALTAIMGYVSLAMLDAQAMKLVGDCLREIERGAKRARDLTQQLLTFAKGGDPLRAPLVLPELIQEAVRLVLHESSIRCRCEFPAGIPAVDADRAQISQVVQNLLRNARQAMPSGGEILLALAEDEVPATGRATPAGDGRAALAPGRYVQLTVTDTGEGIAPENLPRIFEPYFSTRKSGSGLGLATVYSIVKKHGGCIEVSSTPGKGTTFRLWLPVVKAGGTPAPATAAPQENRRQPGPARLLLMDDEETIRELGTRVLQRAGYEVTAVADGAAALQEFRTARQAGRPYALAILDLTVPGGMGGREAIERMRQTDPGMRAIVSSGYSNDPVMAHHREHGFSAVVPKPYDIEQLLGAVRQVLAESRPGGPPS